jgi:hypothetical protein
VQKNVALFGSLRKEDRMTDDNAVAAKPGPLEAVLRHQLHELAVELRRLAYTGSTDKESTLLMMSERVHSFAQAAG